LWEKVQEVLNRDELKNVFLLAKEFRGTTALLHATFSGNVKTLGRIRKWANGQL
jgi:hypothetical protein